MHEEVLPPSSLAVLDRISGLSAPSLRGWTLAGGTGLALQLGHRLSEDFDFFRPDPSSNNDIHKALSPIGAYETVQDEPRTLSLIIQKVRLSFFVVDLPWLSPSAPFRFFHVAGLRDIAAMKIAAISSRGARKDFIDLYFLLGEGLSLEDCLMAYEAKFGAVRANQYLLIKSLTWFGDAEAEPTPKMLATFDWEKCKSEISNQARNLTI